MAILTAPQKAELGQPPKAPGPTVKISRPDGTPSEAWTTYQVQLDAWLRKLTRILGA